MTIQGDIAPGELVMSALRGHYVVVYCDPEVTKNELFVSHDPMLVIAKRKVRQVTWLCVFNQWLFGWISLNTVELVE